MARTWTRATLGIVIALTCASGCERNSEQARALIESRRASWAREMSGIRQQQALLAGRFQQQHAGGGRSAAEQRMRAVVEGSRQSIIDVESQLSQAATRMEQAAKRGGSAGDQFIEEESVRMRQYLQTLGEQLAAAAQQLDEFARIEHDVNEKSL